MISQTHIFMGSVAGVVGALTWFVARLLIGNGEDERLRQRLRGPSAEPRAEQNPSSGRLRDTMQRFGQAMARPFMPSSGEKQSAVRRQLGYAGIYSASAIRTVTGCKVLLLCGGLAMGYGVGSLTENLAMGISLGGLVGYLLPGFWLKSRINTHRKALELGLPDALDLMVVCVEAGLTVDAAMQRISQELSLAHPRLSKEMEITHMETRVGLSRSEALRNMGQRTGCEALRSLGTMLIQAERFGTSIAQSLRVHAESMRVNRQHRAEEIAAKAAVKLTFPVVLFIFPAVLIVLAGPAMIGLFKSALFNE